MSFKFVTSDAQSNIYTVTDTGDLLYYRDEARNGTSQRSYGGAGQKIGEGWGDFLHVFSGGDGIIYAIASNGDLLYYRDEARNGTSQWSYGGVGQKIGEGWGDFLHVFSGDGGIIYAVTYDGDLLYYRDEARNGTSQWSYGGVGQKIGEGWAFFPEVFSGGGGVIYAIPADGFLLFYKDEAGNGTSMWAFGGVGQTIGSGWFIRRQTTAVEGYCTPLSVFPGETIEFKVSARSDYDVNYVRLKQQDDGSIGLPMMDAVSMSEGVQSTNEEAWENGCGWQASFTLEIPADWKSGLYAAQCTDSNGDDFYIVFIAKPNPDQRGDIAVLANSNTWNAYNDWGGRSKYTMPTEASGKGAAPIGSFERPHPYTTPVDDGLVNHMTRAELWVLNWLEDAGYQVDVYSDYDFHSGIDDLASYKVLILNTHPEYWTVQMRDNLVEYLSAGGSLLYLGGNGVFERCKYINDDNALEFFGGDPSQGRERNFFRNLGLPEREILGVGFLNNNHLDKSKPAPYKVEMAEHHFFDGTTRPDGTRLANGDLIGQTGLNRPARTDPSFGGASGWEMDTSDSATAPFDAIVTAWLGDDRGSPPTNIQLLARGTNEPVEGPVTAHMTYYETGNGGFVFSVGSVCFCGSLVLDANLQIIVKNALNQGLNQGYRTDIKWAGELLAAKGNAGRALGAPDGDEWLCEGDEAATFAGWRRATYEGLDQLLANAIAGDKVTAEMLASADVIAWELNGTSPAYSGGWESCRWTFSDSQHQIEVVWNEATTDHTLGGPPVPRDPHVIANGSVTGAAYASFFGIPMSVITQYQPTFPPEAIVISFLLFRVRDEIDVTGPAFTLTLSAVDPVHGEQEATPDVDAIGVLLPATATPPDRAAPRP